MKFSAEGPQEEARIWRSDYDAAHFPIAGSDPTSLCSVCFGLVVVVWFLFAVFFCFWLRFFGFLLGQLAGLRTGPLPVLLWLSTSRQPCMIITIHLFAAIECV